MTFNHAVVWIDHQAAHIIHFNADSSTVDLVKTSSNEAHLHHHRGTLGSGKAETSQSYLHEVVESMASAKEVLVVDHPTDPQLLAFAKRYFLKVDNLLGDNF
jgi:hypothetical protein